MRLSFAYTERGLSRCKALHVRYQSSCVETENGEGTIINAHTVAGALEDS